MVVECFCIPRHLGPSKTDHGCHTKCPTMNVKNRQRSLIHNGRLYERQITDWQNHSSLVIVSFAGTVIEYWQRQSGVRYTPKYKVDMVDPGRAGTFTAQP